jgi:YesN/AraC family two-component response regulator
LFKAANKFSFLNISIGDDEEINIKLYIKYIVSIRCKMLVKAELEKLGIRYKKVELGEAEIEENISLARWNELNAALKKSGIELMDNKKSILIEKIKNVIVELVHYCEEPLEINFSDYLSQKLNHDYTYLANLFSESQGITIEHFLIMHKIERVKELLVYNELNITEIAWKTGYSSVAHLSNQFKKMTGLTPSFFKKIKDKKRSTLEDI